MTAAFILLFVLSAATGTQPDASSAKLETVAQTSKKQPVDLRIVVTGDINLNRNRVDVRPDGADVWGNLVPFEKFPMRIEQLIDGDINFGNIETVISDRNDLPEKDKAFCFKTHPNGIRMLLKKGFNLFSLANNHSFDYGPSGVAQTLKYLRILKQEGYVFHWAGLGRNKAEAIQPAVFTVKGIRVGFTALGIGHSASPNGPGVGHEIHYREALRLLRDADVDLRIISNHDGKEGKSIPIDRQLRVYREAIGNYDVDIVVGHHPHVVQGIERYKEGIIFYSLGNFMIRGAADMGKRPNARGIRDFGLLGRLDLAVEPGGKHQFRRLEIVPIYDMHQGPHPFDDSAEADLRIDTVNQLSSLASINQNNHGKLPPKSNHSPLVFKKDYGVGVIEFSTKKKVGSPSD